MLIDTICKIVENILEIDENVLQNYAVHGSLGVLGLDSIRFVRLIVELERQFGVEINDSDLEITKFETLALIETTMSSYLSKKTKQVQVKKVLVTDCDNVLWRGIYGEEDVCVDDANRLYHNALNDLYERGVLICVCSANQKDNIVAAFETLPLEFASEKIVVMQCGCLNKANAIIELSNMLNLNLNSFVFVDDSEYELGLIEMILPEVSKVRAEDNGSDWVNTVLGFFEDSTGSAERTKQYKVQAERERYKAYYSTIKDYNKAMATKVDCRSATLDDAKRIAELSQRSNQFNLAATKYTEEEVNGILNSLNHLVIVLTATDRFGDMGLVCCAIVSKNEKCIIDSFMVSCRVFGREFENILLEKIRHLAKKDALLGIYRKTAQNKRFENFYGSHDIETIFAD